MGSRAWFLVLATLSTGVFVFGCGPSADSGQNSEAGKPEQIASKAAASAGPVNSGPDGVTTPGEGTPITFTEWKSFRKGDGSIEVEGKKDALNIASFDLKAGGKLELRLAGPKLPDTTFLGTWAKQDDKTVELKITDGWGNAGTQATGTLKFMDADNPYELAFDGTIPRTKSPIKVLFKIGA